MRKILAITLALSLAMSGAAFAEDYTLTPNAANITGNWGNPLGGDTWAPLPLGIYPGDGTNLNDTATLTTTAANTIRLNLVEDSKRNINNPAGSVTLAGLILDATQSNIALDVKNTLTVGTLTSIGAAPNAPHIRIGDNFANGDNGAVVLDELVVNSPYFRVGLGVSGGTFQLGGITFVPQATGTYTDIANGGDTAATRLTFRNVANGPVNAVVNLVDDAVNDANDAVFVPGRVNISPSVQYEGNYGDTEVFLTLNDVYDVTLPNPLRIYDGVATTADHIVLQAGTDTTRDLLTGSTGGFVRTPFTLGPNSGRFNNGAYIAATVDNHGSIDPNSVTITGNPDLYAAGQILLHNEMLVARGANNRLAIQGLAGNSLLTTTDAFTIVNKAHSNSALVFGGIENNEHVEVVVRGVDFFAANNPGGILANDDGIRLTNVELAESVAVRGTFIPEYVHASTIYRRDLPALHNHETVIDLSYDGAALKGRTTIDTNNRFSDAEFTFGGSTPTITLDRGNRGARALRSGQGVIAEVNANNYGVWFLSNRNKLNALLFRSATLSDLTGINAGGTGINVCGAYFNDSVINGLATVDGLAFAFNNSTVRAANDGLTVNGELDIRPTASLAAASTANPTVTVAENGNLYLGDVPTLSSTNGSINSITINDGGTLWLEGDDTASPNLVAASNIDMHRVNFKSGATLLVNANRGTVTYLAQDFAPEGDMTLGINDTFPNDNTLAILSLNNADKIFTVPLNSTFAVTNTAITNTWFQGGGQFRGVRADNTVTELNVPASSTLQIGRETYVFDVNLNGTLSLTSFPVVLSVTTYDADLDVASTAKLDLTEYGRIRARADALKRVSCVDDLLEIIKVGDPSTPYEFLYAKDANGGEAVDIFNAAGVKMIVRPAPNNELGLDPDWLYSFPVTIAYNSNSGVFSIVSSDIANITAADFVQVEKFNPDEPVVPTTGTIDAPTPVNTAENPATNKYVFEKRADALKWAFSATQTIGDTTVTLPTSPVAAYIDGNKVSATAAIESGRVVVTLTAADVEAIVEEDDEFTLQIVFGTNEEYKSGTVEVSVGNGVLKATTSGTTNYDLSTASKAEFALAFENKFVPVDATDITWAVAGKTGTTKDVAIDIAGLDAGTYPVTVTATYGALTITDEDAGNLTLTKSDKPKGGSSGGGCSAGVASLALLLAIPMLLKKR